MARSVLRGLVGVRQWADLLCLWLIWGIYENASISLEKLLFIILIIIFNMAL